MDSVDQQKNRVINLFKSIIWVVHSNNEKVGTGFWLGYCADDTNSFLCKVRLKVYSSCSNDGNKEVVFDDIWELEQTQENVKLAFNTDGGSIINAIARYFEPKLYGIN